MQFKHLLAKSSKDPDNDNPRHEETLVGHTEAAVKSFKALFGSPKKPSRLSQQWLRFFKLTGGGHFPLFFQNGLLSCLLHDIGKANSGFQQMVRRKGSQLIRHEHLSGILLWLPEIQTWFDNIPVVDRKIILSSIVCHHLKTAPRNRDFADYLPGNFNNRFEVYTDGIANVLQELCGKFGLAAPKAFDVPTVWNFQNTEYSDLKEGIKDILSVFRKELRKNEIRHRLLMAVRSGLILADSAGSGLLREGKTLESWLAGAFSENDLLFAETIEDKVIQPRIKEIEKIQGTEFSWQGFQESAEELPDRALLLSACGSGKTLAAWRWIKARLNEKPSARVMFLYPTRATASEGFRDYVSWAPEGTLLHSTASFELEGMFRNPEDERFGRDFGVEDRLFALAYWHRRIFSATVHQFLGFMQYAYRSVCLMPLLADSVVVIDEVHSFDRALFSALKKFLINFNVPVLCMTATLPPNRRMDLEVECGLNVFPDDLTEFEDLQKKTNKPRYRVQLLDGGEDEALSIACAAKDKEQCVLWVVNTVDRCQELARKLGALCYHSRFKLIDRKARHDEVVTAFKEKNKAILAVTTQVCEMSLDLDADVLITEIAPITSLIQRMGRCNRHLKLDLGSVYFYLPEDEKPYTKDDLQGVDEFVSALNEKHVSQSDLDELLDKYAVNVKEVERYAAFLQSGPWAEAREADIVDHTGFTVQAILDNDIQKYFELRKQRRSTDGLLLPVPKYPRTLTRQNAGLGTFPLVASATHYSPEFGFFKFPLEVII